MLPSLPGLLAGQRILITGAARGIGLAIARAMHQAGAHVILCDLPDSAVQQAAAQLGQNGGRTEAATLDITDTQACHDLAARLEADGGPLHCLVNNAGIIIREGLDSPRAAENFRRMIDVNLTGTFNVVHAFVDQLRSTHGNIINIASGAAFVGLPGTLGYSPSKGGVRLLTQSLANELGASGVRVNAIAPGVIETDMTTATRQHPARLTAFMARIPAGRLGEPDDIAGPAVFLASPLAAYVNGVTLPVDGGYLAV